MALRERGSQLASLRQWLDEASRDGGRMVFVAGEAGVGKSALVREFCDSSNAPVAIGMCDASGTPRPLGPVADIAAAWGAPLSDLVHQGTSPTGVATTFLAALEEQHIVVVEDAHWSDEATLDVLGFVARRMDRTRSLVIVTYREDEAAAGHPLRQLMGDLATSTAVRRLCVPPLTAAGVAAMAAGHSVDSDLLFLRTGGNPFFVSEVLAAGGTGVPDTVRDAVLARAARLEGPAREALDAAAVVPARVEIAFLASLSGVETSAIDECVESGMLVSEGPPEVMFRNELAREAVEASLPPARRAALHGKAARLLAARGDADPARVAHHAAAAGDGELALEQATIAARRAAAMGARREAVALFTTALRFADGAPSDERAELLEGIAQNARFTTAPAGVQAALEALALRRAAGDDYAIAGSLNKLAMAYCSAGQFDASEQTKQEALRVLEPLGDTQLLAQACSLMAMTHLVASRADLTLEWSERAIGMAERTGADEALARAFNARGTMRILTGDPAGRDDLLHSITIANAIGNVTFAAIGWANLGAAAGETRDYATAEPALRNALPLGKEEDDNGLVSSCLGMLANLQLDRGEWDETERTLAALPPDCEPRDDFTAQFVLGKLGARRGDPLAAARLTAAWQTAVDMGEFQALWPVAAARAELAWLQGDPAALGDDLDTLVEDAVTARHEWAAGELAVWRHRLGGPSDRPDPCATPFALELEGLAREAAEAWDQFGCPYEAAAALANSDKEADLLSALARLDNLGASAAAELVRRRLHQKGIRRIPRGPRPQTAAHPARLTQRETEVLALVADGLADADIAARLFISRKTVGHHVSALLRKLDASSRSEAAAVARRRGLVVQDREAAAPT